MSETSPTLVCTVEGNIHVNFTFRKPLAGTYHRYLNVFKTKLRGKKAKQKATENERLLRPRPKSNEITKIYFLQACEAAVPATPYPGPCFGAAASLSTPESPCSRE